MAFIALLEKDDYLMSNFKRVLKAIASYFGAILISKITYKQIVSQRDAAFNLLLNNTVNLNSGSVCVIFSKDRPLQIYSLLDSYFKCVNNPLPVTVIYNTKNLELEDAYLQVAKLFLDLKVTVKFVKEIVSFKETLLSVLAEISVDKVLFLVDDIVFIKPVNFGLLEIIDPHLNVLSLRHSPFLTKSYTTKTLQSAPTFLESSLSEELLEFQWFEKGCEWSDPWSVDGHFLSTLEVRLISQISDFKAPNTFEIALKAFNSNIIDRKGLCFKESKILNLPINRVQNEVDNVSGNISVDFLLDKWREGLAIDTSIFDNHIPLSTHEEHEIKFRKIT